MSPIKLYTPREFAARVRVSLSTLRRWDQAGLIRAGRYPNRYRFYTEDHVQQVLNTDAGEDEPDVSDDYGTHAERRSAAR